MCSTVVAEAVNTSWSSMKIFILLFVIVVAMLSPFADADELASVSEMERLPGVELSQGITEITGVAISPLLGVSGVGAWRYWKCPASLRGELPWYARPWAWGTGLAVLLLCFLKDTIGTAMPTILKKPFDMVELFENKASALVASGAFVPLVASEMMRHEAAKDASIPVAAVTMSASIALLDARWLVVPGAVLAFLLVWVCSHAINVLIILSPFSTLDALLKLVRTGIIACIGVAYLLAPWLAAGLCLAIIVAAAWLAPAALRLAIFGARFAGDILLPWRGRRRADPEQPHAFTFGKLGGLPARTGGRLGRCEKSGATVFRYRRWCVLDERTVPLPAGAWQVEKGLLVPSIARVHEGGSSLVLLLLPRYRGHEERVSHHLRFMGVRDHAVSRGLAAAKGWLKSLLGRKSGQAAI
jgi:hypothetical protein